MKNKKFQTIIESTIESTFKIIDENTLNNKKEIQETIEMISKIIEAMEYTKEKTKENEQELIKKEIIFFTTCYITNILFLLINQNSLAFTMTNLSIIPLNILIPNFSKLYYKFKKNKIAKTTEKIKELLSFLEDNLKKLEKTQSINIDKEFTNTKNENPYKYIYDETKENNIPKENEEDKKTNQYTKKKTK